MTFRVLLYLDYDEKSGFGHVSRSRAFIEAVSEEGLEIFMCSSANPLADEAELPFLSGVNWIPSTQVDAMTFDMIYVDSYSDEILTKVRNNPTRNKVLVIDGNFVEEFPDWPEIIIDLERSSPRRNSFSGSYLYADALIHSDLKATKLTRDLRCNPEKTNSKLKALVNFGGSVSTELHIKQLQTTFSSDDQISFVVYVPGKIFEDVKQYFRDYSNVEVKAFSHKYHSDLIHCDFLITNSGTSFIEGLYLDIPMVIFNLFSNAQANFEKHRYKKTVMYSGFAADINSGWLKTVVNFFRMNEYRITSQARKSELIFLDVDTIRAKLKSKFPRN